MHNNIMKITLITILNTQCVRQIAIQDNKHQIYRLKVEEKVPHSGISIRRLKNKANRQNYRKI